MVKEEGNSLSTRGGGGENGGDGGGDGDQLLPLGTRKCISDTAIGRHMKRKLHNNCLF